MNPEKSEKLNENEVENLNRLELKERNMVQMEILERGLGSEAKEEAKAMWLAERSSLIAEIVDHPDNKYIRELARAGKYGEAADEVLEKMEGREPLREVA